MPDETTTVTAPVAVTVPAEHVSLVERILAVLQHDAGWIKDNVEAGLVNLENALGIEKKTDPPTA